MPALASSSLNLPISSRSCWLGITPASESLLALTKTMTFMGTPHVHEESLMGTLTPPRNQGAQLPVAQHQVAPQQRAEQDGKYDFEGAVPVLEMGRHRPAQVPGQQDRSKDRRARDQVKNRAGQQDHPERKNHALRISQANRGFHDKSWLHQFHGRVEEQKERRQDAQDTSGPTYAFRNGHGQDL